MLTRLVGQRNDIVTRLTRYFRLEVELVFAGPGEVWLDDDGGGAAIWRRPGGWRDSARAQIRGLPTYLRVFSWRLLAASRAFDALARIHPHEPHWYLPYVGVHPDAAGAGRGTALLAPVLERCDREGTGAYLEATSRGSSRLFRRLGFVPRDEVTVLDSVIIRPMWRPPRPGGWR